MELNRCENENAEQHFVVWILGVARLVQGGLWSQLGP